MHELRDAAPRHTGRDSSESFPVDLDSDASLVLLDKAGENRFPFLDIREGQFNGDDVVGLRAHRLGDGSRALGDEDYDVAGPLNAL